MTSSPAPTHQMATQTCSRGRNQNRGHHRSTPYTPTSCCTRRSTTPTGPCTRSPRSSRCSLRHPNSCAPWQQQVFSTLTVNTWRSSTNYWCDIAAPSSARTSSVRLPTTPPSAVTIATCTSRSSSRSVCTSCGATTRI